MTQNHLIKLSGNIADGAKNLLLRSINMSPKPRWLVFETTDMCNSHCKHCNIWKNPPTKNIITPEELKNILSDPIFSGLKEVVLTGGEVTIRQDLNEILAIIHQCVPNAIIGISTNALLPERTIKAVKFAIKHNIPVGVGVSLDGVEKHHDEIRNVRGNFEKVDWLLHELLKIKRKHKNYKLGLCIGFTLSNLTIDYFSEVRDYAEKMGIELVTQLYESAPYYKHKAGTNKEFSNKYKKMVEIVKSLPPSFHKNVMLNALKSKSIQAKFKCFSMYTYFVLRCNGDIVPCLQRSDFKVGNLRNTSFSELWHSGEAQRIRKLVKECKGCSNTWCAWWSAGSWYLPVLGFYLRHPKVAIKRFSN